MQLPVNDNPVGVGVGYQTAFPVYSGHSSASTVPQVSFPEVKNQWHCHRFVPGAGMWPHRYPELQSGQHFPNGIS